jgi:hypothetical protein
MGGAAAVGAMADTGAGIDGIEARLPRRFAGKGGGTDDRGVTTAWLGLCASLAAGGVGAEAAAGDTPGPRADISAVQSAAALKSVRARSSLF